MLTKNEVLFELRRHIHLLEPDELIEILEGDVKSIEYNEINHDLTINFMNEKELLIWKDGFRSWWFNNERHRDDDKPALIHTDGMKEWWVHGKRIK